MLRTQEMQFHLEMIPLMSSLTVNREERGSNSPRVSFPANPVSSVQVFSRSPPSTHSQLYYSKKDYEQFQRDETNRWKRAIRRKLDKLASREQAGQTLKNGREINEADGTQHRPNNELCVAPFNMASAA
jgi:hypothetical protein